MSDILKALDRNETVTILYHGKKKGILSPVQPDKQQQVSAHPFFGMTADATEPVEQTMEQLRGSRY